MLSRIFVYSKKDLFNSYFAKMTSSYINTILIELAMQNRFQQDQLSDYSPKIQAMARLHNNIKDFMDRKKLFAYKRLNLISGLHSQIDKLITNPSTHTYLLFVQLMRANLLVQYYHILINCHKLDRSFIGISHTVDYD